MAYAQKLVSISLILFWSCTSSAAWLGTLGANGFFGRYSAGVAYSEGQHEGELSFGTYNHESITYAQANLVYRYAPWEVVTFKEQIFHPLEVGIFATYSLDSKKYFLESPSKYPYDSYYDETALRWGFEVSNSIYFPRYSLSATYHIRILDTGLIALYNNVRKDLQYYISSGFSIRYHFN